MTHYDPLSQVFAETRALVAVLNGDEDAAREILDDSLPNERRSLIGALNRLANLASSYCDNCGKRVESFTDLVTLGLGVGKDAPRVCLDCSAIVHGEANARRAVVRQRRDLVHAAVERSGTYGMLALDTGIASGRLAAIRDGDTEPTDAEVGALRAHVAMERKP